MNGFDKERASKVLAVLLIAVAAAFVAQVMYITSFNQQTYTVLGADATQATYLDLRDRDDSTSSWLKRDFSLNGETVDLKAQTVDGVIANRSEDVVDTWQLTVTVGSDCLINNAWCGTVEIHQFVGTDKEAVQTLDLRNYTLGDIKLEHIYDGDLLIPLSKGDYIVYYPSEKDGELNIGPGSELTMGMIFYYRDALDLSDYEFAFNYHKELTDGWGFLAFLLLAIVWIALFAGTRVADASYKRAMRDMELRKSVISSMSGIYSIICIIDLKADEIVTVSIDEKTEKGFDRGSGAREQLLATFGRDAMETYADIVREFVDLGTVVRRLERGSVVCEYVSKTRGWTSLRFLAVEREEGMPLEQVLFTVQDISDEKKGLERFEERVAEAELENRAKIAFIAGASARIKEPMRTIMELDKQILNEATDAKVRAYARQIKSESEMLSLVIDGAIEVSRLAAGSMEVVSEPYSLKETIRNVRNIVHVMVEGNERVIEVEVSPTLPDKLAGDASRLEQVLINLLANSLHYTHGGSVKMSVYGKSLNDNVHLVFSVRDCGKGFDEQELKELIKFLSLTGTMNKQDIAAQANGLEMVAVLLAFMGSQLHVASAAGRGSEFYFELEQAIVDPSPIGDVDFDANEL